MIAVAKRLPESGMVILHQLKSTYPFGTFPEVQMRYHQPGWSAVFRCKGFAVIFVGNESLAVYEVGERHIRSVAALAERCYVLRPPIQFDVFKQGIDTDTFPACI